MPNKKQKKRIQPQQVKKSNQPTERVKNPPSGQKAKTVQKPQKPTKKPSEKTAKPAQTNQTANKQKEEKLNAIQRFIAQIKLLIFRKKYKERDEFRYNNLTDHPNYNFEEENGKVKSFGITHSEETFGRKNMPLKQNPQKGEAQKAYVRNGVISEKSKYYGEKVLPDFEFSPEDKANVKSKKRNYKKRRKRNKKSKQARR